MRQDKNPISEIAKLDQTTVKINLALHRYGVKDLNPHANLSPSTGNLEHDFVVVRSTSKKGQNLGHSSDNSPHGWREFVKSGSKDERRSIELEDFPPEIRGSRNVVCPPEIVTSEE